jgi:DNA-binding response OmpR family regulator
MPRILVIEDEPTILENILQTLELEHFEVRGAPNGLIGIQLAREHSPDLVICDIMMPEMDGYEVLAELRNDPRTALVPVIFLTARVSRADLRRGMNLGADDYVTKPFTVPELLEAIRARLEKRRAIESEVQKLLDELRHNIVSSIPHEFRTPLSNVMGYASILIDEHRSITADEILHIAQRIQGAAARLYRLVENYLIYAQIELAAADPRRLSVLQSNRLNDPGKLISVVASHKAHEAQRSADMTIEVVDAPVCISESNFMKLAEELLDNALKFSKPGDAVEVHTELDDGRYILHINNQGRSMTEQQIAEVGAYMQFERKLYEQQGVGLGLIIAKRLAELHGGGLKIESQAQQGTSVRVWLRRA